MSLPVYKNAAVGMDCLPALLGVGFIIGPTLSAYMLAGAVLGWIVLIPLISNIGSLGYIVMFPADVPIQVMDYWDIWDMYIRYIGAGAVAFGGILVLSSPCLSLFKHSLKPCVTTPQPWGLEALCARIEI